MATENKKGGFSLIEMLIYISILVFMLTIIMEVVISIGQSSRVIKSLKDIENSAILSIERLTREVRRADSINLTSSILGSHPGKLVLEGVGDAGANRDVEFYLSGGRIRLKENTVDIGVLTATGTVVTNLKFNRFATTTSEGVRIEMTLESGTSTHYRTETFYSSVLIR